MADIDAKPPWEHCYYVRPGYLMPTVTNSVEKIKKFDVRSDDVFIVTYPRSGTYWLTRAVRAIMTLNKSTLEVDHTIMDDLFITLSWGPFPDFPHLFKHTSAIDKYNARPLSLPREVGTHLLPEFLPTQYHEKKPKTIYLQRNPKDVAVSFYFMHFASRTLGKPTSWDHFFEEFLTGNVEFGSWMENVKQWSKYKNQPGFLWLKYEDMLKNPMSVYYKIAHFLEITMTEKEMEVVMRFCDFKYMQEFFKNAPVAQDFMEKDGKYVRKGKVGDWKNYFTVAQNEAFDKMYHEEMKGHEDLKYDF